MLRFPKVMIQEDQMVRTMCTSSSKHFTASCRHQVAGQRPLQPKPLISKDFERSKVDPCLFILREGGKEGPISGLVVNYVG